MANQLWSQDNFSKGELSPYMYARASVQQYYNGLKTAQNVLTYPQGAAGKRFGTYYRNTLTGFTSFDEIFFQTFQYLNECVYQILFKPDSIDIFLEGILIHTVTATGLDGQSVYDLDYTVLQNHFRVSGAGFRPKDLSRSANAADPILSVASNEFTLTTGQTAGFILPVRFTNVGGALPTTVPQIKAGVTYFAKYITATTVKIYYTSLAAALDEGAFTLTNIGTGTNNLIPLNTWTFANVTYKNTPIYDFDGGYDTITFTPAAVSGAAVVITMSAILTAPASMTNKYIGGAFIGGGGVGRITGVTDTTHFTVAVETPFDNTAAISGKLCLLAEPAWSDARGWPQKCSSYQNRSCFANSDSLPNGFWASAINDYSDFNDLETDDDDAISWYPTSDEINFIRFIVPYRSLTVHTNSGVFSNPLSFESAITPKNFSLQLQDSTPADFLQPKAIDNQIIVVSGNDVHSLLWDGLNNAYTSDIVSVMNEQLIRTPLDEAAYVDLRRAGSRYVFIINENGSMAIYQTLITQGVAGWTPAVTEQSYGASYFRQVATNFNGRGWFVTEREIATASVGIDITALVGDDTLVAAHNFDTEEPTAVKFTTTGSLPASTPALNTTDYFWVVGVQPSEFKVYANQEDALEGENEFTFTNFGTNSKVVPWDKTTTFMLEELSFDTFLDCASVYSGSATDTVTGLSRFNAQDVKMVGDGFGFEAQGNNDEVVFEAHGEPVEVSEATIGFPIRYVVEPLPLSLATGANIKTTVLTRPVRIRNANFMFNNTIGGTINGKPIALKKFDQANIGEPPVPARGVMEFSVMKGWDDFNNPVFTIEHDDPFNIELLGVFYDVDI